MGCMPMRYSNRRCFAIGWLGRLLIAVVSALTCPSTRASDELPRVTTQEAQRRLADPDWVVVDTRIPDAYNGWALEGLPRGGHLPGSVDFSARWLDAPAERRDERLREAMRVKRISAELSILLCDANGRDHQRVAEYLRRQGCERLAYYPLHEWAGDPALPLDRYPEYWRLVPPVVVRRLLDGQRPENRRHAGCWAVRPCCVARRGTWACGTMIR
jgi:molybdopterin synthase sulfurtransferase